jgi:fatty-acyl-CoA synthase
VLALILAVVSRARRLWLAALLTLAIPAGVTAGLIGMKAKAGSVPPIHDYATDWTAPLMPSDRLLAARGPDANPVEPDPRLKARPGRLEVENWADDRIARIGSEACPGARPVRLALGPAEAEARVEAVLAQEGLALMTGDELGRVEATDTSFWYGFKDDVIARIRPDGTGSRVDLRSISRVGGSDLGDNCERITAMVTALSKPDQGRR